MIAAFRREKKASNSGVGHKKSMRQRLYKVWKDEKNKERQRKDKGTMETSTEDVKTSKVNSRLI